MTDLEFYRSKKTDTIGGFIDAVLSIDNAVDAGRFFIGHVADVQERIDGGAWKHKENAIGAAQMNIGWCFGEGMSSERVQMWVNVCGASHPWFGQQIPTMEEAINKGLELGRSSPEETRK